jgi:membrane protein YqaA with SNARE-associated domain
MALSVAIPIIPFAIIGELPGDKWLDASGDDALLLGLTGAALLAADVLMPIPSSIVGSLLGARLGFVAGFLWTFLGLMVGNVVGYFLGRLLFSRDPNSLPSEPTALALLVSRPVPVLAEALSFAAGATKLRLSVVLFTAGIGNAAYALALCGSGAAWLPQGWAGPGVAVPLLIPVAGYALWKWKSRL